MCSSDLSWGPAFAESRAPVQSFDFKCVGVLPCDTGQRGQKCLKGSFRLFRCLFQNSPLDSLVLHEDFLLADKRIVVVKGHLVEEAVFDFQNGDALLGNAVVHDPGRRQGDGNFARLLVDIDLHLAQVNARLDGPVVGDQQAGAAEGPCPAEEPLDVIGPPVGVGVDVLLGNQLLEGADLTF